MSNVASRLCDEAKPGQILISPRVLTKVENAVKVEPVGEFELKGIRRPLAAYNVVGDGVVNAYGHRGNATDRYAHEMRIGRGLIRASRGGVRLPLTCSSVPDGNRYVVKEFTDTNVWFQFQSLLGDWSRFLRAACKS